MILKTFRSIWMMNIITNDFLRLSEVGMEKEILFDMVTEMVHNMSASYNLYGITKQQTR